MRLALPLFVVAMLTLAADAPAFPQSTHPAMTDPSMATETAPETFRAKFETTKGDVVFECTRSWAPNGVDRFYNLVKIGYFDDVALFRVAKGFVAQWGIHGDPSVNAKWRDANIAPDPVKESNKRGTLTYAMAASPDTRSTQVFINYGDNVGLDARGFAPICKVVEGMQVADSFNGEYGERVTGKQADIQMKGNAYLRQAWPNLDYIKTATIVGDTATPPHAASGGPDAQAKTKTDEGDSKVLFYIVGAFVIAAAVVMYMTRSKEGAATATKPAASGKASREAPRKKKKKKTAD